MSIEVSVVRAQRRRMQRQLRKTKSRIEALWTRMLPLLHEGYTVSAVASLVGCVRATVYRTVYCFEALRQEALRDQRSCREPTKLTPQVEPCLLGYLDGVPKDYGWDRANWTLELLALQLQADTGVKLSCGYIHRLLRRWGCRRGRPRPGLRIPLRGRRKVLENIEKLIASASPEEVVFCQDEADLHLSPKIGPTYLKRGQQPVVLTPGKNVKRYIFGALNARTGYILHGIAEQKTVRVFTQLLDFLSSIYPRTKRIHLVLDNYITHKPRCVEQRLGALAGRIVRHFLPSYSPDDNVIERLWKRLHDHVTRNHRHRTIDPLVEDVRKLLDEAQPFPSTQISTLRAAS
ncbi:MAG: IS630 family transposase [Gammaproteobacteria bacterium]|nr:IS630 family transposase [Gammaproteobacteria bacterium]